MPKKHCIDHDRKRGFIKLFAAIHKYLINSKLISIFLSEHHMYSISISQNSTLLTFDPLSALSASIFFENANCRNFRDNPLWAMQ